MIRPLGIAEIRPTFREAVRADRRPDGIGECCGGFDCDGGIRCPGDAETELVVFDAKVGGSGQDHGVWEQPGGRGTGSVSRAPARVPRQVIDGDVGGIVKDNLTKAGSVTLEIDSCQASAFSERILPDIRDTVGDDDAGQATAALKRIVRNVRNAAAHHDVGEPAAKSESLEPDDNDIVGDDDPAQTAANERRRKTNKAIWQRDMSQAGATPEHLTPNEGDAAADRQVGQA